MFKLFLAIALLLLCATLLFTGCSATGSADLPPLDPSQADAAVEVKGMSCPQCSHNIALLMDDVEAIHQTRVDLGSGKVWIAFAEGETLKEAQIVDLVDRAGFTAGEVEYLNDGGE